MIKKLMILTAAGVLGATSAAAQLEPATTPCPVYKAKKKIDAHMAKAFDAVPSELTPDLIPALFVLPRTFGLCAPDGVKPFRIGSELLKPTKAFDQLYYVGNTGVGVWILKTSGGLVMFDAMNNDDEARTIIEPGMKELGLDPAQLKYIIVTHAHFDHWGGAGHFRNRYGTKLLVGAGDEDTIKLEPPFGLKAPPVPAVDDWVEDGRKLRIGDSVIDLYVTPGHTRGTLSAIFEITDEGRKHKAALYGGYGLPPQLEPGPAHPPRHAGLNAYIRSFERFTKLGSTAGVDVAISTHPFFDGTISHIEKLREGTKASPWVMGKEAWIRYSTANLEVAKAVAIMEREHPVTGSY